MRVNPASSKAFIIKNLARESLQAMSQATPLRCEDSIGFFPSFLPI